jgi:HlyD family secretion protein
MNNLFRVWQLGQFALTIGIVIIAGCGKSGPAPKSPSSSTVTPTISVVQPVKRAIKRVVEQPGAILPYEETLLFARVPGYLRLFYDENHRIIHDAGRVIRGPKYDAEHKTIINEGEVLAEIEAPELVQRTGQKQAMVVQVEAEADQTAKALIAAEANVAVAKAMVDETRALFERWDSESRRLTGLVKDGVVDTQSSEETRFQRRAAEGKLASAKAGVDKAVADRDKAIADVHAAKSRIDVAKADAAELEAMLGYTKIRAPYDGIITVRKLASKALVQPNGGPDGWLFKVARLDPVRVVIAVPESDAELIQENAEVKLTIQAHSNTQLKGKVVRTSWALEPTSRTLRTEIDLPNKDAQLRPGMYVYAYITHEFPAGWTVPISAVGKQGDATVCFVIENGKAVQTPVRVVASNGQFAVIRKLSQKDGVTTFEEFTGNESIAAKAIGLADGQTVHVE